MRPLAALLLVFLSLCSYSQPPARDKNLDLVLNSASTGFTQLRADLDSTQLPDTLYRSLITIEGTTDNYIRCLPGHAYGYFATLGEGLSLTGAKTLVKSWKAIIDRTLPKYALKSEKIRSASIPDLGYLIIKTDDRSSMQIHIAYHKPEQSNTYEALLYFMFANPYQ